MKCDDCGFEHSETGACPHCGYDPSVNLLPLVRIPQPPVVNPLGEGSPADAADPFKAIRLCRAAALQGNPIAIFFLVQQHLPGGLLREDLPAASAVMQDLLTVHPTLFRRAGGCSCHQQGLSDVEFAKKTAGQLGKMIKYAVIAGIIFLIISILKSEF